MDWSLYGEKVKTLFEYFNANDYMFFIIFVISIIYILFTEKEKKVKILLTAYSVIIMCIIFNPLAIKIFEKMINFSSIYRIYYMLPLGITISYAATKLILEQKNKYIKAGLFIFVIGFIMLTGDSVYKFTTVKVGTLYKLPDEVVQVATILAEDEKTEFKRAIVPYGMSSQIGQITAKVQLLYTRVVANEKDEEGNKSPVDTDDIKYCESALKLSQGDVEYIGNLANKSKYNYVVYPKHTPTKDNGSFENYGFELIYETENYWIFRSKDSVNISYEEYKKIPIKK